MMGSHSIHIQAHWDGDKKCLSTMYKLMDEELGTIVADWPLEWKVLVSIEYLSDTEVGTLPDSPIE